MTKASQVSVPDLLDTLIFSWESNGRRWEKGIFFDAEGVERLGVGSVICFRSWQRPSAG